MVCILQLVGVFFIVQHSFISFTLLYSRYPRNIADISLICRFRRTRAAESILQFAIKEVLSEMRARHWFLCAFHVSDWDLVRLQNIYIFHNQQVHVLTDWMSRDSQLFFDFQKRSQRLLFSYHHRRHCHLLIYILGKQSNMSHLLAEATMCYHVIMEKNDSIHMIP